MRDKGMLLWWAERSLHCFVNLPMKGHVPGCQLPQRKFPQHDDTFMLLCIVPQLRESKYTPGWPLKDRRHPYSSHSAHQSRHIQQAGDEIKMERGQTSSQHIVYGVLLSIDVVVHPSGLYCRGAPAGLINVIRDKTTLCGTSWNVLVVTVCGSSDKRSINFRAHVLQMCWWLLEFIGALVFVLTFRWYRAHPPPWNGIYYILFFSPAKTVLLGLWCTYWVTDGD